MTNYEHFPFSVRPIPFPAKSFMPYLNARTLKIHHDGHYTSYINKLNKILECFPEYQHLPLEALILKQSFMPREIRNDIKINAGGAFNHMLYFECLAPHRKSIMSNEFKEIICNNFNSTDNFINILKSAALSIKGSGFAYLASDTEGKMHILTLKDFETPFELRLNPLLPIDMWEHAYYLQFQYHKKEYVDNLLNIINWQRVERNYFSA